jgi:phage shock protein PspC (stress-responsive transcriptional regulator)
MQKVISINLNGNAYQLDESGHETLRQYLARAEQQLGANPDRGEIMGDLEQAIADKCQKFLGPHKTVVAASEVDQIVAEMGPVNGVGTESSEPAGGAAAGESTAGPAQDAPPRRLYRIPAGAMIAGVCTGVAAYFKVDVTLVRIGFVVAALVTKGAATFAYVAMMFIVPEAETFEEQAAAGGKPFNAKEVIDRAGKRSADAAREWRRAWRRQRRAWGWYGTPAGAPLAYAPPPKALVLLPVFGLVHVALFLAAIAMLISLVNTGAILTWELPPDVPVWAAALILLIGYQIVVAPIRAMRHVVWYPGGTQPPPVAFWNAVIWLVGLAFAIWLASNHIPEIREFVERVPSLFREFVWAMRDLFERR